MIGEEQVVVGSKRDVLPAGVAERDIPVGVAEIGCLGQIVEP